MIPMDRNMKLGCHLCNDSHFQEDGNNKNEFLGRKPHIFRLVAYRVHDKFPRVALHVHVPSTYYSYMYMYMCNSSTPGVLASTS